MVTGRTFDVIGKGAVIVIDGRGATVAAARPGEVSAATNLKIHLLRAGMRFDPGS